MSSKKTREFDKQRKEDILTYRFYLDLLLIGVATFLLIAFTNAIETLQGVISFPESVSTVFIISAVALALSIAYKVYARVSGKEFAVLPANFTLAWSGAFFVALGILLIQTNTNWRPYNATLTAYIIILVIYTVLCLANFFLGGDYFEKLAKKVIAKIKK